MGWLLIFSFVRHARADDALGGFYLVAAPFFEQSQILGTTEPKLAAVYGIKLHYAVLDSNALGCKQNYVDSFALPPPIFRWCQSLLLLLRRVFATRSVNDRKRIS
jgi:hypothetical protein